MIPKIDYNKFASNPGSPIADDYSQVVDDYGAVTTVKVGSHSIYDQIQSFADSCDINNIIARFENGDLSALNVRTPVYGDFTRTPKTLAEMLQKIIDAKDYFESLPVEVRQKFNNDPNQFLAQSSDKDFLSKLGIEEVKSDSPSSDQKSSDE